MIDADNKTLLKKLKVKAIVNMARESQCFHPDSFEYLHIKGSDTEGFDIGKHFKGVTQFIHDNLSKGNVFVHCVYGISRGSTAIIAYLMKYQHMTYMQARRKVERARPHIYPNFGFVRHLKDWAKELVELKMKNRGNKRDLKNAKSFYDTDYIQRKRRRTRGKKMNKDKSYRIKNQHIGDRSIKKHSSLVPNRRNFKSVAAMQEVEIDHQSNLAHSELMIEYNPEIKPRVRAGTLKKSMKSRKIGVSSPRNNMRHSKLTKMLKPMIKDVAKLNHEWRRKSLDKSPLKLSRYLKKDEKINTRKFLSDRFKRVKKKKNTLFSCKGCGIKLFYRKSIIPHSPMSVVKCDTIFTAKMNWMKADYLGFKKLLVCPNQNCRAVLGMMSSSGIKCSCTFIETPGFQIYKKMITEKHKILSNDFFSK